MRKQNGCTILAVIAVESPPPRSPSLKVGGHQDQRGPLVWAHFAFLAPVVRTLRLPEIIWLKQAQHLFFLYMARVDVHEARARQRQGNSLLVVVCGSRALVAVFSFSKITLNPVKKKVCGEGC